MAGELANAFTGGKLVGANIRYEDYARQTAERGSAEYSIGRGDLMEFDRCPHRWLAGYEPEESKATEWGEMLDCLTLTPAHFETDFAVAPATYVEVGMKCPSCGSVTDSKKCAKCKMEREPIEVAKEWSWNATYCREWKEEHKGLKIRTAETVQQGQNAVKILYGAPETREVLECSDRQVMVVSKYQDKETGVVVPVRVLIDLCPRMGVPGWQSALGDLKTCQSLAGKAWSRKVYEFGYHVQAAFYLDVYRAATGEERTEFFHVCQESFPPWEPARKILSAEFIELGRWRYRAALERYAQCIKTGVWPGYDNSIVEPEPWMLQ